MDKENARVSLDKIIKAAELLGECKAAIQQGSSGPEEAKRLLTSLGQLLGDLYDQLVVPLVVQHPELRPPQLREDVDDDSA